MRSAALLGKEFTANVGDRVLLQRYAGMTALLRAVMHQAIFANVEVASPGAAAPLVGTAFGNIVLKPVEARVMVLFKALHLQEHFALDFAQRLELPFTVVNDADGGGKANCTARRPTTSASWGLWMPPPTTELMLT